jgi:ribosomal protein S18 acetylase RimI-like enzyme
MINSIIPLSSLPASILPALADLHTSTMPTLLADLGQPVVLRYYQLAQKDPSVIALCATFPLPVGEGAEVRVLGYALGSPDPSALNAQLRQPIIWFVGQVLRLAFTRPPVLWQLVQSVFSASDENTLAPGQLELTYIGVDHEVRGQGLGKTLLTAFVDTARIAEYKSVVLSVETDNPAAIALYTKFGFTITKTFSEGHYHRHRMEYKISKPVNK